MYETPNPARKPGAEDTPLYEKTGEELVKDRLTTFHRDAAWREEKLRVKRPQNELKREEVFAEARWYCEAIGGKQRDSGGDPQFEMIPIATSNVEAFVLPNVPNFGFHVTPRHDERWFNPDVLAAFEREAHETGVRMTRVVEGDLSRSGWERLKRRLVSDAVRYGVGYVLNERAGVVDPVDPRVRNAVRDGDVFTNGAKRREVEFRRSLPKLTRVDPEEVYWQNGVASVRDEEMLRVSRLRYVRTDYLRKLYPEHDPETGEPLFKRIMPGGPKYGLYGHTLGQHGAERVDAQTGVLETWEVCVYNVEETEEVQALAPDGGVVVRRNTLQRRARKVVYTKIAGDVLVEHEVWDEHDPEGRPVCLPIAPFYVLPSDEHPYGISIPIRLKLIQDFINRILFTLYRQAEKSWATTAFAVMAHYLGASDSVDEIDRKAREGGAVPLELTEEAQARGLGPDDVFRPFGGAAQANLAPGLMELLRFALDLFRQQAEMVDLEAYARARTGAAKAQQEGMADRPKTPMIAHVTGSVEHIGELVAENWRGVGYEAPQVVPVPGGFVVLGERARVPVRRMVEDGRGGYQPVVVPPELAQAAGVPVNGQGEVMEEETVVLGHTYLQWEARADNRNWLPADPIGKFNVLSALMAQGLLSPEQVREEVVPEEMREEDDEKRAAAAEAAAQKQAEMMEQLATALNAKVVEGAAALGTTPQAFRSLQAVFLPELLQKTLSEMEAMTSAS